LKPFLKKIDAVKNAKDLEALLIEMEPIMELIYGCCVGTDAKTAAEM
jgi:hypothetical protein